MTTYDLTEILGPITSQPVTVDWLASKFSPQVLAHRLLGEMQQNASAVQAILAVEARYDYQRGNGPLDTAKAIAAMSGHKAHFAARKRTDKFRELAELMRPFWCSDRHRFRSNVGWAEFALSIPEVRAFRKLPQGVQAEAVSKWPKRYGWNPEAKKRVVS